MIKLISLILLFNFILFDLIDITDCKIKITSLINRKTYLIPMRTKFILKCSTTKFTGTDEDDLNRDDQFDDDQPELIVLNNLEQTKKLVEYFSKLNETKSSDRMDVVGWNKTMLSKFKLNGYSFEERKFNKYYEDMYLAGRSFYEPNDNISLFGNNRSCLLFTSFTKRDESIYSCFYRPRIENWFTFLGGLFDFDLTSLTNLVGSSNNLDNLNLIKSKKLKDLNLIKNKKLKDLNLINNIPLIEKLIYLTCLFTWPFKQECYLVKQFKLQIESDQLPVERSADYWNNLDSHDQYRFKKLLRQLTRYCSPLSHNLVKNTADSNGTTKNTNESNIFIDLIKVLFNDLFVNVICDLINNLFSFLFHILFNDLIGSLFDNLIINTISELLNEIINDLFISSFKDLNLLYLIYFLLFIFILISFKSDSKKKTKKTLKPMDTETREENMFSNEHGLSISKSRDETNLKFNINTTIVNKRDGRLNIGEGWRESSQEENPKIEEESSKEENPKIEKEESLGIHRDDDNIKKLKNLFKPINRIEPSTGLINREKWNKLKKVEFKLDDRKEKGFKKLKNDKEDNLIDKNLKDKNLKDKNLKDKNLKDKNLEFNGEIKISKLGQLSYLGKFQFNLPKELEHNLDNKPLQLILDTSDNNDLSRLADLNLPAQLNLEPIDELKSNSNDFKLEDNFSNALTHETVSSVIK